MAIVFLSWNMTCVPGVWYGIHFSFHQTPVSFNFQGIGATTRTANDMPNTKKT